MFQDLDSTIKAVLTDPAAPTQVKTADISFATPDKTFAPAAPTLNLFLYDVRENRELRDPVPILEKQGSQFVRRLPPMRVECSYMVTAWSAQMGDAKVVEEHRLLALTLAWLGRFPRVPENRLQGSMTIQPFAIPVYVGQGDPNKPNHELWHALGISPRALVNLRATVALDVSVDVEGPLVTTKQASVSPGAAPDQLVQIGGRVVKAATLPPEPIAAATIDVDDAVLVVTTGDDGRYVLPRITAGSHTLRATAVGFHQASKVVTVPALPEQYDFELTPL